MVVAVVEVERESWLENPYLQQPSLESLQQQLGHNLVPFDIGWTKLHQFQRLFQLQWLDQPLAAKVADIAVDRNSFGNQTYQDKNNPGIGFDTYNIAVEQR